MNLQTAVQTVLGKYADFNGRARRSEFWYWYLTVVVAYVVLFALGRVAGIFALLGTLVVLAALVPTLAAGSRRLHDTGKSGWLQLIAIIPVLGTIALLVLWAGDSQPDNQYGPNPKALGGPAGGYGAPTA